MNALGLLGGFALYAWIILFLDLWLGVEGSGGSVRKGIDLGQNGAFHAGAPQGDAPHSSLPHALQWAAEVRAQQRQAKYEAMWNEIRGSISGGKLRAFRESGLPSPVVPFAWLPEQDRNTIVAADCDRILGTKEDA